MDMNVGMITGLICCGCGAVGLIIFFWGMGVYNGLIRLKNRYKTAFAQIDVQLKRRYDLIPNLVETAKGYLQHERQTLEAVVQARSNAFSANQAASADPGQAATMNQLSAAETQLTGALGRLMAVFESYPDLKANQNMLALQEELTTTENKIAFARQAYNDSVMNYNTAREVFPASVIAGMTGFQTAAPFEIADPQEKNAPQVKF